MSNNGSAKYENKYRTKSLRLPCWDYSDNGYYFVTICTKDMECIFGDINHVGARHCLARTEKEQCLVSTNLSNIGQIVQKYWQEIPIHFPFVRLDEFIYPVK